jgi:ketosteroid isomerase-like protein
VNIKTVAEKYFQAWEARDLDAIMALHSADTIVHSYTGREPATGLVAVRAQFAATFQMAPDVLFKAWDMRFGDDFWVAQMIVSGSRRQPDGASKSFSSNCADVIQVKHGLITRKDSYVDTVKLFAQLGSGAA